jgi:hypothetical protein
MTSQSLRIEKMKSLLQQKKHIRGIVVHFFAGAAEQSDDLTMLAIQYKKEYSEPQFSINNV